VIFDFTGPVNAKAVELAQGTSYPYPDCSFEMGFGGVGWNDYGSTELSNTRK